MLQNDGGGQSPHVCRSQKPNAQVQKPFTLTHACGCMGVHTHTHMHNIPSWLLLIPFALHLSSTLGSPQSLPESNAGEHGQSL